MTTIIIPCYKNHIYILDKVLNLFILQKPEEIIVVVNGIENDAKINTKISELKTIYNDIVFLEFNNKLFAGPARYEGLLKAKNENIIFHDADDEPHPQKVEIINHFLKNHDHILHLIQPIDLDFKMYDKKNISYITNNYIRWYCDKYETYNFNNLLKSRIGSGLISAKKSKIINIKWKKMVTGEDSKFNKDSLLYNNNLIILKAFLSKHDKFSLNMMKKHHYSDYLSIMDIEN